MRPLIALLATGVAFAAAIPAEAATRPFPVSPFSKLRVEGPYTVRVHTGGRPSVVARGPQARLDKLLVEKRGDQLVITSQKTSGWGGWSWGKEDNVTIDVTVPMLNAADLTGSGDVGIDSINAASFATFVTGSGNLSVAQIQTGQLTAKVTGSGDLTLTGRAGSASASVTGSGDLHGAGLAVGNLTASVTGSGDIAIGPTKVAKASVMGSGDISIAGRPACTVTKRGSGDVRCGG